jgi:hypothetical protein
MTNIQSIQINEERKRKKKRSIYVKEDTNKLIRKKITRR